MSGMRHRIVSNPWPPTIETDRLLLRALKMDDTEAVFAYASDPEVSRYVGWPTHTDIQDSRAFLDLTLRKYESGGEPDWGIVYKGDGRLVGTCGFTNLSRENDRAEIGYVLHRHYWGRGLTTEAARAIIRHGFDRMGLNRIEARCIAEHTASSRVMEKAGMSYEGTLRQREVINGAYQDMNLYAILRKEHHQSQPAARPPPGK